MKGKTRKIAAATILKLVKDFEIISLLEFSKKNIANKTKPETVKNSIKYLGIIEIICDLALFWLYDNEDLLNTS